VSLGLAIRAARLGLRPGLHSNGSGLRGKAMQKCIESTPLLVVCAANRGAGAARQSAGPVRIAGVRQRLQSREQDAAQI
jgi:hypothetical protein